MRVTSSGLADPALDVGNDHPDGEVLQQQRKLLAHSQQLLGFLDAFLAGLEHLVVQLVRGVHGDLHPQNVRIEGLAEVVYAAGLVALLDERILGKNGRHENDRRVFATGELLDAGRRLEAVHLRHLHVHENEVDLIGLAL